MIRIPCEQGDWICEQLLKPYSAIGFLLLGFCLIAYATSDYLIDGRRARNCLLGITGAVAVSIGVVALSVNWR